MSRRRGRTGEQLQRVVAFYRDGLGLPEIDRFVGHDGYSGVMLDLPGTATHLEFTATGQLPPPVAHLEDLLVLYLGSRQDVDRTVARTGGPVVPSANPYWDRVAVTVADPDGFRVVLVPGSWPS
jgi:catechol 2,3-dioxygenase-like lactoylglutathione lyase family enzyme